MSLSSEFRNPKYFYGYVIVLAAFIIQVTAWGTYNTFGVFFNPLATDFYWSRATISGAASLSLLLYGFVSIFAGSLNDRFGPRLVMAASGAFLGVGYLLMSRINTIWQLYFFYGLIVAIGMSGMDVVLLSTIARWFVKKRGMMSGIAKVGTGLGIVIMPLLASGIIGAYDWRVAFIVFGIMILVLVIPIAQLLRRDPAQMRLLPDGEKEAKDGDSSLLETGLALRKASRTRQFWILCGVFLTIPFCTYTVIVHTVPYAIDLGISATMAASIISVIGGASITGRFIMGSAADRIGNKLALIICFLTFIVAFSWLQLARDLWMLYLFASVYGFGHGGFFTLISPTVAGLFGIRSHGVIFGITMFSGTIGGAIGPVLAGYIFDVSGSYRIAFLMLVVLSVVGLLLTALLKPIRHNETD